MKHLTSITSLLLGGCLFAGNAFGHSPIQSTSSVTPPAINNGSNFSRAPFLASRQFGSVETTHAAAMPETVSTEPVVSMTGRPSVARPVIMTTDSYASRDNGRVVPPAVQNGSNFSRAPIPSARQFDDIKAPDGQAVDVPAPVR